jgi:hypothetical protein
MCLQDGRRRSLTEVTHEYNKRYPPAFGLFPMKERVIQSILGTLEGENAIKSEILSYTTEVIPQTKFFSITNAGFQEVSRRR